MLNEDKKENVNNINFVEFSDQLGDFAFKTAMVIIVAMIPLFIAAFLGQSGAIPALYPIDGALQVAALLGCVTIAVVGITSYLGLKFKA